MQPILPQSVEMNLLTLQATIEDSTAGMQLLTDRQINGQAEKQLDFCHLTNWSCYLQSGQKVHVVERNIISISVRHLFNFAMLQIWR